MRLQVSAIGLASCQGCGLPGKLRTLDVAVPRIPKRKRLASVPPGWLPIIGLCGTCWDEVIEMLKKLEDT